MLIMQEQSVGFDPCYSYLWRQMPVGLKVYVFFLLAVVITAIGKVLNIWRVAPPFKKPPDANGSYFKLLGLSKTSIGQWME